MNKKNEYKLDIGIPNGLILTVLGLLVLVTPVFHSLETAHIFIDVVAGLILIGSGIISLYFGIKNLYKKL